MPDEQTPEIPPLEEPEQELAPPAVEMPPVRNPIGWLISGVMFFLFITYAVSNYLSPPPAEKSFSQLQNVFKSQVSVAYSSPEKLKEKARPGLEDVLTEALEDAGEYEEAARIAVVAAYELGEEPDNDALITLTTSEDELSQNIATLYSTADIDSSFVDTFTEKPSREFAVTLAQSHAREMIGEDGEREKFLDKNLLVKTGVLGMGVAAAGVGGLVCLVLFFVARSANRLKPVGFANFTKQDGDISMLLFACYMIGFALLAFVANFIREKTSIGTIWISALILLALTLIVIILIKLPVIGKSQNFKEFIGGKATDFWKNVGVGLYGYLCTVPVLLIVLSVVFFLGDRITQPSHPVGDEMARATMTDWIAIGLTTSILAPLLEEITFRGLLFPALASQFRRPLWAILICGFLFAAIHPQGPWIWPALMMTGSTAAYVRYYTGSLIPSITLHFVHNSAILGAALLTI